MYAALLAVPVLAPASNARATCAGTGSVTLDRAVGTTPAGGAVGFMFSLNCLEGGSVGGAGTLTTLSCVEATGSGAIVGVGNFTVLGRGTTWTLSGAATGTWHLLLPLADCIAGSAPAFGFVGHLAY